MKTNKKTKPIHTAEGAKASHINPELQLRRSVMACMLWEKTFYEDGESITDRIKNIIPKVKPEIVSDIAIEAREKGKLRHIPLLLVREMARLKDHKHLVAKTLERVIQRPDELSEFVSIYWKGKRQSLSAQVKKGLARAFTKFSEFQLSKWNKDGAVKLKDVLFLCHAKPKDRDQGSLWKKLIANELKMPDSWETAIPASKGINKKEAWERLLRENKIPALALLKNLRNLEENKVDEKLVFKALEACNIERVLPFRFITAARYVPRWEHHIEKLMLKCLTNKEKIKGKTVLILDVSGSMNSLLSSKGELNRLDSAAALGILARELCEDIQIYATAGNDRTMIHKTQILPARHGFALRDAFTSAYHNLGGGGIFLKQVMDYTYKKEQSADRVIVFTDEQDCDRKCNPSSAITYGKNNYLVNISSEKNGIGYGKWIHIDGFSEHVLDYILLSEKNLINKSSGSVLN